ncbi:MAG: hypothetical protein LBS01_10900 [Prevotellaceae bacterium]|jgi:hypothetical protein|nr:hypothetical protein [Prevotellaceae bacterium]
MKAEVANGGSLIRVLKELEQCTFIRSYNAFGKKTKEKLFQLIDFFALFYLNFIQNNTGENFWTNNFGSPFDKDFSAQIDLVIDRNNCVINLSEVILDSLFNK